MKRLLRPTLAVFTAALAVAILVLAVLTRDSVDARRHAQVIATFDAAVQAETSLDRDLLQVMAGLLPHYDTVVAHGNALTQSLQRLEAEDDWVAMPTAALRTYRDAVTAKLQAAEQIKATAAFVRKEEAYLPFAIEDFRERAGFAVLRVQAAMIGLGRLKDGHDDALEDQLSTTITAFSASADAGLRNIGQHMRALMNQRVILRSASEAYFAIASGTALEGARQEYMAAYTRHQTRLNWLSRGLPFVSLALFAALGIAISRLGKAQDRAERAHAQLMDAVSSLQEAFALFDGHRRLVLSNGRYDSMFPARGRIESFRALLREVAVGDADGADPTAARESLVTNPTSGRTYLFRTHPTSDGGNVCLFTDLTDQQRVLAQVRKLTAAVEQSPIAIIITDEQAVIEYVNPRFVELTGYGAGEILGQNPRLLKSGEVPPAQYEEMWKTLSSGLTWRGQLINRKKNGDLFWENAVISPIRDQTGRITNYVALKEDITQQKLNADMLIDANADNERMLFAASHDLQEPVRQMQTYCQLLERQLPDAAGPATRESMRFIMDGAHQLSLLIKGMAAYSRSNRPTTAFVPVDCAAVVQGAIADCRAMAAFESPLFRVGQLPTVMGDPVLLMMLFQNLIGNALKFRRPDRPAEIGITAVAEADGWRFDIADNGIGIEKEYLGGIASPFSRLHSRATHPGSGLGLASCQKIAKTHGGRLWLESEPGQGTVAHVWLPIGEVLH